MKLQRIEPDTDFEHPTAEAIAALTPEEEVQWTEGDDYSKTITLSNGMAVKFRDMTGADLKFVETLSGGNIDRTMRLACRLCVKWGDRDGVTPPQLDKVRAKDFMLISRVIESFLE